MLPGGGAPLGPAGGLGLLDAGFERRHQVHDVGRGFGGPGVLDDLLAAAPDRHRWAVELRDPSWLHDDVFAVLERHGAALCLHDLLDDHPWLLTTGWTYLRFHGPSATTVAYAGRYGPRRLGRVAERIEAWRAEGVDVWGYFNNDQGGHAWEDARWLARRVGPSAQARPGRGA